MKGKIESLGEKAQKKAIKLSVEGLSSQAIADELAKDYGPISSNEVLQFLKRQRNKTVQLLAEQKNFQTKLVNEYFDTVKQIKELNGELWKFFYELRKNPEYKDKIITCTSCGKSMVLNIQSYGLLLKTADSILKQIDHVDKVLGKLQKKSFNITYNFTDMSRKIAIALPNLLHQMEQRGIVKINKKRLKLYQGGKKMSNPYEEDEDELDEDETGDYGEDEED